MMYDGQHWFGGGFMWIFWIFLVVAIFWGIKEILSTSNKPESKQSSALDILKERYARGEIDHEEFERRKQDLTET